MIDAQRRWLFAGLLAVTLAVHSAPAQAVSDVDGYLQSDDPVQILGNLSHEGTRETLYLSTPRDTARDTTVEYHADSLRITQMELDIQGVESERANLTVYPVPDKTERTVDYFTNATFRIEDFGPNADFLLSPTGGVPFQVGVSGTESSVALQLAEEGLIVRDGFRETNNISSSDEYDDFEWEYQLPGPVLEASALPAINLGGSAEGYVWDTNVTVENESGVQAQYETGLRESEAEGGAVKNEHYEYLLIEARGLNATIEPEGLQGGLYGSAMSFDLDGRAQLPEAMGSISSRDTALKAGNSRVTELAGQLDLEFTPQANAPGRLSVGVEGELEATTLQAVDQGALLDDTSAVAVGAGSATALGVAAWYLLGAKGLTLVAPATRSRDPEEENVAPANIDRPRDLLFDPDRFALYHLVRSRPGLTAAECRETTGIESARPHLDLLVEHGLLEEISQDPARYALPGSIDQDEADMISFLRQPAARDLAEVLTVHGLVPEDKLKRRVELAAPDIDRDSIEDMIQAFVDRDLAYRERGDEGYVLDPRDSLFSLLERMGESEVPRVS